MTRSFLLCVGIGVVIVLTAPAARAEEYFGSPSATLETLPGGFVAQAILAQSATIDSNPLLSVDKERTVWGSITSPELILSDKTPRRTLLWDTVVDINNFNRSSFSSTDVHSVGDYATRLERWSAGIEAGLDYDTTRTSEPSDYNNNRLKPVRHLGGKVTPRLAYDITPLDKLSLRGTWAGSEYYGSGFTDYAVYSIAPSFTHQFDPMNTGSFTVYAQRYEASNGSNTVDTIGPFVGWHTLLTPRLDADASVGFQETRQKGNGSNRDWEPQLAFAVGVNFKGEQDRIKATISRSEYPFGNGTEAFVTQFAIKGDHVINELFAAGAKASYETANYQNKVRGDLESLTIAGGRFIWHALERLDVIAAYEFQHETLVQISGNANKHIGLISVAYRPTAWEL